MASTSAQPALQTPVDPTATARPAAAPNRLVIPSIDVNTGLERLALDTHGRLPAPRNFASAGWYAAGVRPGDTGPAIIAGHVDSRSGPAIFFRLRSLERGDAVRVRDAAGTDHRFTVTESQRYPKSRFPTDAVYGPTAGPVLRLITCTGDFDRAQRSYRDNLIVTATLDTPRAG